MERLTFEGNFCDIAKCKEHFCEKACSQREVWERLKYYEDLEEQGRLRISNAHRCPKCGAYELTPRIDGALYYCFVCKTRFTREEAETALKGDVKMRLIDADALKTKIDCPGEPLVYWYDIESAPTIDPDSLVKRGRWVPLEYSGYADGNPVWDLWECSECREEHSGDEDTLTPFCPNCGAKMDKEEDSNA